MSFVHQCRRHLSSASGLNARSLSLAFFPRTLTTTFTRPVLVCLEPLVPSRCPRLSTPLLQVRGKAFLRQGPGREIGYQKRGNNSTTSKATTITNEDSSCLGSTHNLSSTENEQQEEEGDDDAQKNNDPASSVGQGRSISSSSGIINNNSNNNNNNSSGQYKAIVLAETDFRERFIKGGGNGGQKINKTNSNVELKHFETGIVVQCQATRSLPQNRKLARRILTDRLDEYYNGEMSKRGQKAEKIRERKKRMARKSAKKYQHDSSSRDGPDEDKDEDKKEEGEGGGGGGGDVDVVRRVARDKKEIMQEESMIPIELTTLEEILASDNNKKPSRRKAKK